MTETEYNNLSGWRSTQIKNVLSYGLFDTINNQGIKTESEAFAFGNLFHTLVLEPELFNSRYAIEPKFDKRTKTGKEEAEAFQIECFDKGIITTEDYNLAKAMSDVVMSRYGKIIEKCRKEVVYTATINGVKVKCKVDLVSEELGFFADLKSTAHEITKRNIEKITFDYSYHVSYAFYKDIIEANKAKIKSFGLLYSSKKDYRALFYEPNPTVLEHGRAEYAMALEKIGNYEQKGIIEDAAIGFNLPAWLIKE